MPPTSMTIRVDDALKEQLGQLAKQTNRSLSYVAAQALEQFVNVNAWQIDEIHQRLQGLNAQPGTSQTEVERWLESWGTDSELDRPASR